MSAIFGGPASSVPASGLTGTTLPSNVVDSSLTSLGTLAKTNVAVTAVSAYTFGGGTGPTFTVPSGHGLIAGNIVNFCGFNGAGGEGDGSGNWQINNLNPWTILSVTATTLVARHRDGDVASGSFTQTAAQSSLTNTYVGLTSNPALVLYTNLDTYRSTKGTIHLKVDPLVNDIGASIVLESTTLSLSNTPAWLFSAQGNLQVGPGLYVLTGSSVGVGTTIASFNLNNSYVLGTVTTVGGSTGTFKIKSSGTSIPASLCMEGTNGSALPAGNCWLSAGADGVFRLGPKLTIINANTVDNGNSLWAVDNSYILNYRHLIADGNNVSATQSNISAAVGGNIVDYFADAGSTGTTETTLFTKTTVAGTLAFNGDGLTAEYAGIFVSNATNTRRIRAYFATVLIFDSAALTSATVNTTWNLRLLLVRVSATVVRCSATFISVGATSNNVVNYTEVTTGFAAASTNVLSVSGTGGAGSSNNDIVGKLGVVAWKPRYL